MDLTAHFTPYDIHKIAQLARLALHDPMIREESDLDPDDITKLQQKLSGFLKDH